MTSIYTYIFIFFI